METDSAAPTKVSIGRTDQIPSQPTQTEFAGKVELRIHTRNSSINSYWNIISVKLEAAIH